MLPINIIHILYMILIRHRNAPKLYADLTGESKIISLFLYCCVNKGLQFFTKQLCIKFTRIILSYSNVP